MKFAAIYRNINPDKPVKQAGFIQQTDPISEVHDDLQLRLLALEDETQIIFLASLDILGVNLEFEEKVEAEYQKHYDKKVHLILHATHTHFGGNPKDEDYQKQVYQHLLKAREDLKFQEYENLRVTYSSEPFTKIGQSRISDHQPYGVFLDVLAILNGEVPLAVYFIYNCHPTILSGYTPYFTSEYPGQTIRKLKEQYPGVFFSFGQSAAGDVSTRFTRKSQEYPQVEAFAELLAQEVSDQLKKPQLSCRLTLEYRQSILSLEHEILDMDSLPIPENLTDREKETIRYGAISRQEKLKNPENLSKSEKISCVSLGEVRLIFAPNELFSDYLRALDKSHASLICYANGYEPYVVPVGFKRLTYEFFTDTFTQKTKQDLFALLTSFGN
ncbi:MAG: hypothetical protein LBR25_03665 [Erysipelotrichaceae bacterium]|jgi:hypothetical protein|nr:hypothetical protein [Erysipelotrichaceae bacterium]